MQDECFLLSGFLFGICSPLDLNKNMIQMNRLSMLLTHPFSLSLLLHACFTYCKSLLSAYFNLANLLSFYSNPSHDTVTISMFMWWKGPAYKTMMFQSCRAYEAAFMRLNGSDRSLALSAYFYSFIKLCSDSFTWSVFSAQATGAEVCVAPPKLCLQHLMSSHTVIVPRCQTATLFT